MKKCFFENFSINVIMNEPSIIGADKKRVVVDVPKCSGGYFVGFLIVENSLKVSDVGYFEDLVFISGSRSEDSLEIVYFQG